MNKAEALAWIANIFEADPDTIKPETKREDIMGWDSLGVLALMSEMDSEFDILLSAEDMAAMTKVSDILLVLENNGKLD